MSKYNYQLRYMPQSRVWILNNMRPNGRKPNAEKLLGHLSTIYTGKPWTLADEQHDTPMIRIACLLMSVRNTELCASQSDYSIYDYMYLFNANGQFEMRRTWTDIDDGILAYEGGPDRWR